VHILYNILFALMAYAAAMLVFNSFKIIYSPLSC